MIRRPRGGDAEPLAQAFVDDPGLRLAIGMDVPPTAADLRSEFEQASDPGGRWERLVIASGDDDTAIGMVFIHEIRRQHRRCEIGFYLAPGARGQGLGTEAVRQVVQDLFAGGFERIEMTTTPDNRAVFGLAQRLGFEHEGTLRSRNVEGGRRVDIAWFGLLRP